jgi:hypothetical protein
MHCCLWLGAVLWGRLHCGIFGCQLTLLPLLLLLLLLLLAC